MRTCRNALADLLSAVTCSSSESKFDVLMNARLRARLRVPRVIIFCRFNCSHYFASKRVTCLMRTAHSTPTPLKMMEATSGDFQPPLEAMTGAKPKKRTPRKKNVIQVPPAELLLDDKGRVMAAVGPRAIAVAAIGTAEKWPLPEELLLLLEPVLQPEVLAEVGLEDR